MVIQQSSFNHFFSRPNTEFVIPVYQRNYAWQKQNCKQLLDDILAVAKDPNKQHFLGTITYIRHPIQPYGDEFVIIDGQQRITTLMLLLKALQSKTKDEGLIKGIASYLNFGIKDETKIRLKPIKKDREALKYVMSEHWTEFAGYSNIKDNYRFFIIEINKALEKDYEVGQIFNSFAQLQISTIELEQSKGDDPQMIFERINATGLHLKGLDLIRNFLMMELKPDEQERIFNDYWAKIEEKFSDEKDSEKIIQKFISVYLRIYKGANVKDDEIEIYKSFKDLRKDTFDDDSEKILKDMIKFARIYKIIIDKNALWQYDNEIPKEKRILREKINLIDDLQFGTAYPFAMRLIDDFENGELDFENLSEILNLLISFFVRRSICALPTASLNKMLYPLYNRLEKDKELSANAVARYFGQKSGNEVFPNISMLKRNFESTALFKSKKIVSLVLYEIEKLKNHEVPELENLNIEHFYPQTPTPQWRKMVGEEANNLEQNYLNTLGNLTLLNAGLNSKVGNKSFEDKIKLYKDNGSLHLNRHFEKLEKWEITEIIERAQYLFKSFVKIEIFKDIDDEFRKMAEVITLDNDWTGLEPNLVKMPNDEEKNVASIRNVAKVIIDYLIANHSDNLENVLRQDFPFIYFGEVCEISSNNANLDFGEFRFVCNGAAENIRKNLCKLVEACELEPSEFEIKVKNNSI